MNDIYTLSDALLSKRAVGKLKGIGMVDVAKVKLLGIDMGTFLWDESYNVAKFEYDHEFATKGIEPSPAYDMGFAYNPNGAWTKTHQMSINCKFDGLTRKDLLECAATTSRMLRRLSTRYVK